MNKSPLLKRLLLAFKKNNEKMEKGTQHDTDHPPDLERHYKVTKKILGKGSFAVVKECVHRHTGQTYALKIIQKKDIEGK